MQLEFAFTQTVLLHRVSAEAADLYRSEPARTRSSIDSRGSQGIACVASPSGALASPSRSSAAREECAHTRVSRLVMVKSWKPLASTYRRRSRAA